MRAARWPIRRRVFDRTPKLLPGKHRYTPWLDYTPSPVIVDPAKFTAWAETMFPATTES